MYSKNISGEKKLRERDVLFQKHAALFNASIRTELKILFKSFDRREINNVYILHYYRYYGKVHIYIKVHQSLAAT